MERLDPTERFSDRVADYVRYRPGYPRELIPILTGVTGLRPDWVIADIGSGTGLSAELFLQNGNRVIGVEPNAAMRAAAEQTLAQWPGFESVPGRAEQTELPERSIDLVFAGQAFHWFDPVQARAEFRRILKAPAWTAVAWNRRRTDTTPFSIAYETLLQEFGTDYQAIRHDQLDPAILDQFFAHGCELITLANQQVFDFAGTQGRLLSSSYTPAAGDPRRTLMLAELRRIFDEHQAHGQVSFDYDTLVYAGRL